MNRKRLLGSVYLSLLLVVCALAAQSNKNVSPKDGDYDFVIVGAGTAGAIVAARLSASYNVLLIESGDRLYDDATLSAQYFSDLLVGKDTASMFDSLNPFIKSVAKILPNGAIEDDKGNKVGSMDKGIPGFMPHLQETPFMCFYMSMTEACHVYPTVPQIYSQKREIDYPRGNVIGGSSAANTMVYFRGSARDFEEWKNDLGLTGWGYQDVLPFFKKFENNQDISDGSVHGFEGPINITISKKHFPSPAGDAWTQAAIKLGYPVIEDASNPETTYGASDSWQTFVGANGRRSDTSAYIRQLDLKGKVCWNKPLSECSKGQTLSLWTRTFVTKVLIDEDKRAYGVEYVSDAKGLQQQRSEHNKKDRSANEGAKHHSPYNKWDRDTVQRTKAAQKLGAPVAKELAFDWNRGADQYVPESVPEYPTKKVTARYEIILSAGSVGSGQLLMLSGIGPQDHLLERKIKVVADLPVGKRMQDHQEVIVTYKFPKSFDPGFSMLSETAKGFPQLRAHLRNERSFFSANQVPAGLEGSSAGPTGTVPKWHLHHITAGGFENFDWNIASYKETIEAPYRVPRSLLELYSWKGMLLHYHNCELSQNHAYGRLELRNKDPFQPPFLDPRYGSSDEDNSEIVHCIQTVRELMKVADPDFVGEELEPSASAKTAEQINQFVRNNVWGHHISGSAPMGNSSTWYAVTDERARVYKVQGLRIADISLFPTIPHGNPAGVVMMMGEKIAQMILEDYSSSSSSSSSNTRHEEL